MKKQSRKEDAASLQRLADILEDDSTRGPQELFRQEELQRQVAEKFGGDGAAWARRHVTGILPF